MNLGVPPQSAAAAIGRRIRVMIVDDAVVVRGPDTHEIGRGLVAYDAEDAEKIKGRSSPDVMAILGISGRAEMIHRDDLVVGPSGTLLPG